MRGKKRQVAASDLLRVPSAAIGGQRKETAVAPSSDNGKAKVKPKGKPKQMWKGAKPSRPISGASKIVSRNTSKKRIGEVYVVDGIGYVAGLTATHARYRERVDGLVAAIVDGRIHTTEDAKKWLSESKCQTK